MTVEEIPVETIHTLAATFPGRQPEMVVASVAAGNNTARLWSAGSGAEGVFLLWDQGNNVFYLTGAPIRETVDTIATLVSGPVREQALRTNLAYFKTRALSDACESVLPDLFPNILLRKTRKHFFHLRTPRDVHLPEGVRFAPIDRSLLERDDLENLAPVREEVGWMWPSLERFYQNGFGRAAICDEKTVCWCTAEYASPRQCGIGIETVPQYQGRGIASAATRCFADDCARRRIIPHWECDPENGASVRVAEKVGFERVEESIFWAGSFAK